MEEKAGISALAFLTAENGATMAIAATGTTSSIGVVAVLVFYGILGYGFAVLTRRSIGTTPWRLPAITWALVSALFPLFGLLLEMLARLTTRHASSSGPARPRLGPVRYESLMSSGETAFPANPAGGTTAWPSTVATRPGPGGWVPSPLGTDAGFPPLFGWYPDPDGRHEERYWDGRTWSDHVRDGGIAASDPLGEEAPWVSPTPPGTEAGA